MKYLIILVTLLFASCSLLDNDAPIPSYIEIESVSVSPESGQGADTHKITDVWVYIDSQLSGVYELPAKVPVIMGDRESIDVSVFAGIRNNGAVGTPFIYQFYERVEYTLDLKPEEIDSRSITFNYVDAAKFDFVEGFENPHIFVYDADENAATNVEISTDIVKSGIRSGHIHLDTMNSSIQVSTINSYERSNNAGTDSYLEMDYYSDIPFLVGMITTSQTQEVTQFKIVLNPTYGEWNKIYIDFTDELSDPEILTYRVILGSDLSQLPENDGDIYLDNLKFVHF